MAGASLMLASCAAADPRRASDARSIAETDRQLAEVLGNRIAGTPQNCVDQSRLLGPERVGKRDVIYRQSGRRVWRTTLREDCTGLGGDVILVAETYGTQLCAGDRFQVVNRNSGISFGYCFYGPFVPYDKPAKPRS